MDGTVVELELPLGNLKTSVEPLVRVSIPPAVNTPVAMTLLLFEVPEVVMPWKCSVVVAAGRALAAARPAPLIIAAAETVVVTATSVV